jgi:hypothetical protein
VGSLATCLMVLGTGHLLWQGQVSTEVNLVTVCRPLRFEG